jgi:hypothetical protein
MRTVEQKAGKLMSRDWRIDRNQMEIKCLVESIKTSLGIEEYQLAQEELGRELYKLQKRVENLRNDTDNLTHS